MTQWNQLHFPGGDHPGPGGSGYTGGGGGPTQDYPGPGNGGGTQVWPGTGDGGGTQLYPVTPGQATAPPWMGSPDSGSGGVGYSPTHSRHHSARHSGHIKVRKVHVWHAPAHPSHRRALPPGVEDQSF